MNFSADFVLSNSHRDYEAGRLSAAQAGLGMLHVLEPGHARGWELAGLTAFRSGDRAGSIRALRRALVLDADNALLHLSFGKALLSISAVPAAERHFQIASTLEPDAEDNPRCMARVSQSRGRFTQACVFARRAVHLKPDSAENWQSYGTAAQLAGSMEQAAAIFPRLLVLDPGCALGASNMALLLSGARLEPPALKWGQRACLVEPDSAQFLFSLGVIQGASRSPDMAASRHRAAVVVDPGHAEAWNSLGVILESAEQDIPKALWTYLRAVYLRPDFALVHANIGSLFGKAGRFPLARLAQARAAALDPGSVEVFGNFGALYAAAVEHYLAAEAYSRAVHLRPGDAALRANLGLALMSIDLSEEAYRQLRQAVVLQPSDRNAYNNLGVLLSQLGRSDEAQRSTRLAISVAPDDTVFHYNLASFKRFEEPGDPEFAALEKLAEAAHSTPEQAFHLQFALAKACDDLGQKERAFAHCLAGNRMKRAVIEYNEAETLATFDRIEAVFSEGFLQRRVAGTVEDAPIFILGMPRSGSTLVEQILSSAPEVHGAGETSLFAREAVGLLGTTGYPEMVTDLSDRQIAGLGRSYMEMLRAKGPEADILTDKTLDDFRLIGLIRLALPNARIVHTYRDPVDTCLSCFSKLFTGKLGFTYDLGELGRYYRRYWQHMAHWRQVLPPGSMIEVRYEEMVENFEAGARQLLAACGIPWNDACLKFHENKRAVRTASVSQVRQPIYRTSIGRWRPAPALIQPLLEGLGDLAPPPGKT